MMQNRDKPDTDTRTQRWRQEQREPGIQPK